MNRLLIAIICLVVSGCVTFEERDLYNENVIASGKTARRFISLRQVHKGMTRKEVASILGNKIVTGYELVDPAVGQYKPITTKNPYRTEKVNKGAFSYNIDYYIEKINVQDGIVSDDELVPLVFRDDKLVGKGWDFLKKRIKN